MSRKRGIAHLPKASLSGFPMNGYRRVLIDLITQSGILSRMDVKLKGKGN